MPSGTPGPRPGHEPRAVTARPLRFLLNGEPVEPGPVPAQTTLLAWLRDGRGLTGTKEGCAEGDCGACTVVVAELDGEALRWQPVNACLRLLPSLDGKAVFTVESLRERGSLHPVQQALVDAHGSQCGFCTPGFAMSLFALYKSAPAPDRRTVDDALSGNLCRCTGYRPIVEAAQRMHALDAPGGWRAPAFVGGQRRPPNDDERALAAALAALAADAPSALTGSGPTAFLPRSVDALADLARQHPDATLVAGATDVGLWVTKQLRDLGPLIFTGEVAALRRIDDDARAITLGAAVPLADAFDAIAREYPETREAWQRFASPPIRASGTLGGNVANGSPIGDSMPVLIALGASVRLRLGARVRELPLDAFYLDYRRTAREPGEIVVAIVVPRRAATLELRAYKISKRYDQDISAVFAAIAVEVDDGRIAAARIGCGGVAAVPARARATEAALAGGRFERATFEAAARTLAHEFAPIGDMRASAEYRRTVLANLLVRFAIETTTPGGAPTRVHDVAPLAWPDAAE